MVWVELCPSRVNSYVEVLPLVSQNITLFGDRLSERSSSGNKVVRVGTDPV